MSVLNDYLSYKGQIGRLSLLKVIFFSTFIQALLSAFFLIVKLPLAIFLAYPVLGYLYGLFWGWILLVAFTKRLRDIDHSPWLVLVMLIPYLNAAMLLYLLFRPGVFMSKNP